MKKGAGFDRKVSDEILEVFQSSQYRFAVIWHQVLIFQRIRIPDFGIVYVIYRSVSITEIEHRIVQNAIQLERFPQVCN